MTRVLVVSGTSVSTLGVACESIKLWTGSRPAVLFLLTEPEGDTPLPDLEPAHLANLDFGAYRVSLDRLELHLEVARLARAALTVVAQVSEDDLELIFSRTGEPTLTVAARDLEVDRWQSFTLALRDLMLRQAGPVTHLQLTGAPEVPEEQA